MEHIITRQDIERMFELAREQAVLAYIRKEVPIGAIVANEHGDILGYGHNDVLEDVDPFSHAEIKALREALKKESLLHIPNSILVVTLEPCLMCLGSAIKAGVKDIYYSVRSPLDGAFTKYQLDNSVNVHFIPNEKDKERIESFFESIRKEK